MHRESSKMIINIVSFFIALYSLDLISGQGTTQQCVPVLQNTAQVRLQGRSTEDQCTLLTNSSAIIVAANEALFVPGTTIPSSCVVQDIEILSCITRMRNPRGKGSKGENGKTAKKEKSKSRSNSKSKSRSNSRSRSNSQSASQNMRRFEITFQATLNCSNASQCVIHVSNSMTKQMLQDQQQELRDLFRGNRNFPRSFEATGMTVDVRSVRIEQEPFCGSQAISTRSRTRSKSRSKPVQLCDCPSFCPVPITITTTTATSTDITATSTTPFISSSVTVSAMPPGPITTIASMTSVTISATPSSTMDSSGSGSGDA